MAKWDPRIHFWGVLGGQTSGLLGGKKVGPAPPKNPTTGWTGGGQVGPKVPLQWVLKCILFFSFF
jgi:hypothetical protein